MSRAYGLLLLATGLGIGLAVGHLSVTGDAAQISAIATDAATTGRERNAAARLCARGYNVQRATDDMVICRYADMVSSSE